MAASGGQSNAQAVQIRVLFLAAGDVEPDSSSGGSDGGERRAFAPRARRDGTPAGLKRRARSGPLSPEGAEEAGDSVAEARARGEPSVQTAFKQWSHGQRA